MKTNEKNTSAVVKSVYFANWADIWGFPLAYKLVPYVAKIKIITPNIVTIISFLIFIVGSLSLFINYPYHLIISSLLLPLAFLGDDLDGQLARFTKKSSEIGDYLDKSFDVLKIYLLTISLSFAVYFRTQEIIFIFLGFTACFFFNFRYYLKHETIFHEMDKDSTYLKKSLRVRTEREIYLTDLYAGLNRTKRGRIKLFWLKNRIFFLVDEAEFCVITSISAITNSLEIGLVALTISQVIIGLWRWFERGYQIQNHSDRLLWPMRK